MTDPFSHQPAGPGGPPRRTGSVDDAQAALIAPMFKALGEPVRLRLLTMIATGGEVCVCDLATAFDLSGPTISYHLKVLREAGLVRCQRRGTWVHYWVVPTAVHRLAGCLAATIFAPTGQLPGEPRPGTCADPLPVR